MQEKPRQRRTEGAVALENTSPPDSNSNRGFRSAEKKLTFFYLFEHCLIILSLIKLNLVKTESFLNPPLSFLYLFVVECPLMLWKMLFQLSWRGTISHRCQLACFQPPLRTLCSIYLLLLFYSRVITTIGRPLFTSKNLALCGAELLRIPPQKFESSQRPQTAFDAASTALAFVQTDSAR